MLLLLQPEMSTLLSVRHAEGHRCDGVNGPDVRSASGIMRGRGGGGGGQSDRAGPERPSRLRSAGRVRSAAAPETDPLVRQEEQQGTHLSCRRAAGEPALPTCWLCQENLRPTSDPQLQEAAVLSEMSGLCDCFTLDPLHVARLLRSRVHILISLSGLKTNPSQLLSPPRPMQNALSVPGDGSPDTTRKYQRSVSMQNPRAEN